MIATAENAVMSALVACVTCAECGDRMLREGEEPNGEWLCPNLHEPEPDEEVFAAVSDIVERVNVERQSYGLGMLSVSLVYEQLQEPGFGGEPMPRADSLFRQAVQADDLSGGVTAADKAMSQYVAQATRASFKQDYEAFLRSHLAGESGAWPYSVLEQTSKVKGGKWQLPAGFWPWKALERAAQIGQRLGAHLEMSTVWQAVELPNLLEGVTGEGMEGLTKGLLMHEGQEKGDLF